MGWRGRGDQETERGWGDRVGVFLFVYACMTVVLLSLSMLSMPMHSSIR